MARDEWDEFGSPQEPEDGGDDWGDYGDWDTPAQPDGSDEFLQDQGGFQQPQQGGFIQQDADGWGSTSGIDDTQLSQDPNDFAQSQPQVQEVQPRNFNLSMKKVAVIIAVVCVLAALVFFGLDKIHFTKKTPTQQPNQQQQVQQGGNTQQEQNNTGGDNTQSAPPQVDVNSVTLVEIPDTMQLDYNGDIFEINGTVLNKLKYVQQHQVLYCINVGIVFGSQQETISYYCNYSSFNAVNQGDIVILKYQQVNDSYISVLSISK